MPDEPVLLDPSTTALLVVDVQPDFLPGGALAVKNGEVILAGIARLMSDERFPLQVGTQDWHPHGHISFASQHASRKPLDSIELYGHQQTLWPDHCVQGTAGAQLHPGLPWERLTAIVRKATNPAVDSYSAFRNNWDPDGERPPTGLEGYLRDRGVETVVLCGLARDYCVRWSAEDAVDAGFSTYVVWDLTRPVDPASDDEVRRALEQRGVHVIRSAQLEEEPEG